MQLESRMTVMDQRTRPWQRGKGWCWPCTVGDTTYLFRDVEWEVRVWKVKWRVLWMSKFIQKKLTWNKPSYVQQGNVIANTPLRTMFSRLYVHTSTYGTAAYRDNMTSYVHRTGTTCCTVPVGYTVRHGTAHCRATWHGSGVVTTSTTTCTLRTCTYDFVYVVRS